MRLEQLEYLVAVAKAGSISAAARRLNVSRQAVSVAMGNLEKDLGFSKITKTNVRRRRTAGRFIFPRFSKCPP